MVLNAVFLREVTMIRRYLFNWLSGLVSIYMVFCFVFYGMKAFSAGSPGALDGSLEGTVVGFFVWSLSLFAFSTLSWDLINEAQMGTLEQLYLSPSGFRWLCVLNLATGFLVNALAAVTFLFVAMATTGRWLHLDAVSIAPLMIVTVLGAYGVGFILGGLALVFKRIQALFQIVQFVFVGCLVIPSRVTWAGFLPLSAGAVLLRKTMVAGARIWQLPAGEVLMATAVGAGYLVLGLGVFSACECVAKARGLLGHY